MGWRLRDNIHWCVTGGRAIFLDTAADRYFGLPDAANSAFLRLASGSDAVAVLDALGALREPGLLLEDSDCAQLRAFEHASPAMHDLEVDPGRPLSPFATACLLMTEIRVSWLLRTRPLAEVIGRACRPGRKSRLGPDRRQLDALARAAAASTLLLRATDRCLVRALAVQKACRCLGADTKLVFGVRTNPFGAHSWVQLGEGVVVGEFEQVRLYTPIAAFG
jgi:hypothetical protein